MLVINKEPFFNYDPRQVTNQVESGCLFKKGEKMSTSKLQEKTAQLLHYNFPYLKIYENLRPEWLRGKSLEILELDFYIPERKIALEIQGRQHYNYVPHFHGEYENYLIQLERDQIKKDLCYGKSIKLIEIASELELDIFIKEFNESENKKLTSEDQEIIDERAYRDFIFMEKRTIYKIARYKKTLGKSYLDACTSIIARLFLFRTKFGYVVRNEEIKQFYLEHRDVIDEKFNYMLKARLERFKKKMANIDDPQLQKVFELT